MKTQDKIIEDLFPVCIFSVDKHGGTDIRDHESRNRAFNELNAKAIPYKTVKGCYKGSEELGIVVSLQHESTVNILCQEYNQEAYMTVNNYGIAFMYSMNEETKLYSPELIGDFVRVSEGKARSSDGFTQDIENNRFYTVL